MATIRDLIRHRFTLILAAAALVLSSAAGIAATATAAHASVVYGGRCSKLLAGSTKTIGGLTYTCRSVGGAGYWWIAIFYGCGAQPAGVKVTRVC